MTVRSVLPVVLLLGLLSGCGVSGNLRGNPGYAAFDSPGWLDSDRELAVSLGPLPIRLARLIIDDDDPETAELLRGLKAVRVYVYRIDGDAMKVDRRMSETVRRLDRQGWQSLVTVRDAGERVRVMVRSDGRDRVRGLVVLAQDRSELVLVNLIGDLRPEYFNQYMDGLEIETPRVALESG